MTDDKFYGAEYGGDVYCEGCFDAMVKANSVDPNDITYISNENIEDFIIESKWPDCAVCKSALGET